MEEGKISTTAAEKTIYGRHVYFYFFVTAARLADITHKNNPDSNALNDV